MAGSAQVSGPHSGRSSGALMRILDPVGPCRGTDRKGKNRSSYSAEAT
jgi:hypothetical protein